MRLLIKGSIGVLYMTTIYFRTTSRRFKRRQPAIPDSRFSIPEPRQLATPHSLIPHSRLPIPEARFIALFTIVTSILILLAGCQRAGEVIEVTEAWAPATPPTASVGAAYMHIEANRTDTLLDASSPAATRIEVHETMYEDGLVKMRKVETLAVAPGQPVALQPGGMHFMLIGLASPLQASSTFPITLRFHQVGEIEVNVQVVAASADHSHH